MCSKIETHQLTKDTILTLMYATYRLFVAATVYNVGSQQFTVFHLDVLPVIQVKIPKMNISHSGLKLALLTSWCQLVAPRFSWSPMPQLTHSVLASKSYLRKLLVQWKQRWWWDRWEQSLLLLGTSEMPSWSEEQSKQPTVFQHIWRLETKHCRGHWKIRW